MGLNPDISISILTPCKNAGPFLRDCLSSIVAQTEPDWELIVVNDGSTDDSRAILDEFAQADSRITVVDNNGSGIIEALRLAYSLSSGQFITRMDADDIMAPNKLAVLKQNLLAKGAGNVAVGLVKYFSADGVKDGYLHYEGWLNELTSAGANYSDIYRECVIPSPCWMVYRQDLDRCGAFEPDTYPEDYDLAFRFFGAGLKVLPCSEVLHHWRDHSSRSSRTDPNYADNRFLELKLKWFLKLSHDPSRPLVLWGAASKGKLLAKGLLEAEIDFRWMCNNPNKINKQVYGKLMENVKELTPLRHPQVIVAVANKDQQAEIREQLGDDEAFFFC
ncbi:MAG: glycosyltransferase [Flavobacteriales bacterium]|nr:glycosyltransferase [Flavobacteriales bacterium]